MNLLLLILKLFPVLLVAIQTVETAAPLAKIGPAKLTMLKTVAASAYQAAMPDHTVAEKGLISQDQLLALVETISAEIVGFYNLIGVFKKSR